MSMQGVSTYEQTQQPTDIPFLSNENEAVPEIMDVSNIDFFMKTLGSNDMM